MKLRVGRKLAGDFDKNFINSYIIRYHELFPNERIFLGEYGHLKEAVFAQTSNHVTTESKIDNPDNVVSDSQFSSA